MLLNRIPVTLPAHWYNRTKSMIMAVVFVVHKHSAKPRC